MKSIAITITVAVVLAMGSLFLKAKDIKFADAKFKQTLINKGYDKNNDGELQEDEAEAIKSVNINHHGITSLKGIEKLTELTELSCMGNGFQKLDLSENKKLKVLKCQNNKLTELILPSSSELEELICRNNELTSLKLESHKNLITLDCKRNKLTALDLSKCKALQAADCKGNQIESLIIDNDSLTTIDCQINQLKELNLKNCPNLKFLFCKNNQLKKLTLKNLSKLEYLECSENQLKSLTIENCIKLEKLSCNKNNISKLSLSGVDNLTKLDCSENQLKKLHLPKLLLLHSLDVFSNQIEELALIQPISLNNINCSRNNIKQLDLSLSYRLTTLNCIKNPELRTIYVNDTAIAYKNKFFFMRDSSQEFRHKNFEKIVFAESELENWTSEFGGENHNGICKSEINSKAPEMQWSLPVGSSNFSAPLLYKGILFYCTYNSHLLAIDIKTQKMLWATKTLGTDCISTPTLSDGKIFISAGSTFSAVDISNGKVLWQHNIEPDRISSVPAVNENVVIACSFDNIIAFDKESGKIKWKYFTGTQVYDGKRYKGRICTKESAAPVIVGDTIIAGNAFEPELYCININSGKLLWKYTDKKPFSAQPLVSDNIVYAGDDRGEFHAINIKNGKQLWTLNLRNFDGLEFATQHEEFRKYNYVGIDSKTKMTSILAPPFKIPNSEQIILGNEYAILMSIDTEKHTHGTIREENNIAPYLFPATYTGNKLLLYNNTSQLLRAYNPEKRTEQWSIALKERLQSPVSIYNGSMFLVCKDNYLYSYK